MTFMAWTRSCIDMQGYDLSVEEKRALSLPIRFSPAVCGAFAAVLLVLQWPIGLFALAATAAAGTIMPRHPFDYAYNYLLDPILKTGSAPPRSAPFA